MYKTYLLSYDPLMADPSINRLVEFIRAHALTYQFYATFAGSIFIKSSASIKDLINSYQNFLHPNWWTIVEVVNPPVGCGGAATAEFWTWLNSPSPPALTASS